jgi:hypothetical protein
MTDDLTKKEKLKSAAAALIAEALDEIADHKREPDAWEQNHLAYAISLLDLGAYERVRREVLEAKAPTQQRTPHVPLAENPAVNLKTLREALNVAASRPVKAYPGPF